MNKYRLIYDYILDPNSFSLANSMLIPMAGGLLLTYIYYKGLKKYKVATVVTTILAICLSLLVSVSQYVGYKKIVSKIEEGKVKVVEGEISNYKPIDLTNHGSFESFTINEAKFAYSDYHRISGYHHACANGGVICNNGQEVKLTYYKEDNLNFIVRIEILIPNK
ncbi:MAG: hypothetical protein CMP67_09860 [Flavobacteriales bacterium]|nr:hypothetical protein [Flavobacteriales bacterium]MBO72544.1 hypothetical protein [Flavobacteriales bacterium]